MKTKLLAIALLLSGVSYLFAEEKPVTTANFLNEYNDANDGDILLLEAGEYNRDLKFPLGKTITLKAAEGASPVLKDMRITDPEESNSTGGGLIFDGVDIDLSVLGNKPYFIQVSAKNITEITFRNLNLKNFKRGVINTTAIDASNTINKIEFENCIIENPGIEWNFIYTQHAVKEVTVKNSTLYNYIGESFFCVYGNKNNTDNVLNFTFENNTVYKWAKDSTRAFAKIEGNYSSNSTYTFRKNIVNQPGIAGETPMIVDITAGTILAENNLIVDYGGYNGGTQTINDLTLEELGISEPGFFNPAVGDFSISSDSPLAELKIGDPRWISEISTPTRIITYSNNVHGGTTSPSDAVTEKGSTVTILATANFGYRFVEWQDKEGNSISTSNPYTFQLNEDTELTAIFQQVLIFITGFNFETEDSRPTNIPGYIYSDAENRGNISLYSANGNQEWMSIDYKTFGGITHKAPRRWNSSEQQNNGETRYFEADFVADGYANVKVTSLIAADNNDVYKTQVLHYSADGGNTFHEIARVDIEEKEKWYELNAILPSVSGKVYLRWDSDPGNGFVEDAQEATSTEGFFLANVFISGEKIASTSYTRDFYVDGGFETICLPFNVTTITNSLGFEVKPTLYEYNAHTEGSTEVGFKITNTIKANTPYLIAFPEDNTIEKLSYTFEGTAAEQSVPSVSKGEYIFSGVYDHFTSDATYYVLNDTGDRFVKAAATTFVGAYRAYLQPIENSEGNQGIRQLSVVFDKEGTTHMELPSSSETPLLIQTSPEGIELIAIEPQTVHIYTIDGRLITTFKLVAGEKYNYNIGKGIYIINNQKTIVR